MVRTVLYDKLTAAGGRMGEYLGAETAMAFGDPAVEFRQLREGCAVYDLGWRAKILVTGGDRVRWMNGMVTNNIRDLGVNSGNYNFLLSPQGRIQADMYIYNRGEYLLVDTALWQAGKVLEVFDKFIIMDDVEVSDASDKLTGLAVQGAGARAGLAKAGFQSTELQPLKVVDAVWGEVGYSITRMASNLSETYELWMSRENLPAAWDALTVAGAVPAGMDALEMFRVWAGVPRYGQDIRERELPQETEQDQALHFSKGCYVGQEIVERIHARGLVHRTFSGFVVDGGPPEPGTKIVSEGKDVGYITSALLVPLNGSSKTLALGYIRREVGTPGTVVQAGEASATVSGLPFTAP
jgi:aminomethyltransferase